MTGVLRLHMLTLIEGWLPLSDRMLSANRDATESLEACAEDLMDEYSYDVKPMLGKLAEVTRDIYILRGLANRILAFRGKPEAAADIDRLIKDWISTRESYDGKWHSVRHELGIVAKMLMRLDSFS